MKRLKLLIMVLIALPLAGCFRPAGDAIAPTAVEPIVQPSADSSGSGLPTVSGPVTATLPPVTIISPATLSLGTPLAQITPTVMPTLQAAATSTTAPPTAQPQFITPGVVQPLVTIVFPTATPQGGTPSATPSGLITPTAFDVVSDECIYVVQPGDNLFRIAVNNNASLEEMRNANPELVGEAPILQPGQELRIPNCESQSVSSPAATPIPGVTSAPPANPATTTYVVRPGDTLFSIAQQFGTTIDAIVAANSLANPNALDVGQQLIIPQSGG